MHSFVYRVNALLTFAGTVLAVLCVAATITGASRVPSEMPQSAAMLTPLPHHARVVGTRERNQR